MANPALQTNVALETRSRSASDFEAGQTPRKAEAKTTQQSAAEAICEATAQALENDPRVFVMGEGATDPKGIFGTTAGLVDRFGHERVMEMPLSENGWTGVAIGAAMMGQRPIIIHQRVEFALLSLEQLFNNAAKAHYVTRGEHSAPIVVRLVVGRGWGQGPMHSQSLEALFAQAPGLKVIMPSTPADAKGLLLGAVEDDSPVVSIEHRWIHYASGQVDVGYRPYALDGPKRLREGADVTLVSTSYMTLEAIQCADALSRHGLEVELFDLRVIRPLQLEAIRESVQKTGRLVTVDTGFREYGIGAEICSQITEKEFCSLKAAPQRIGLPSHPTPSSASLAAAYYPRSPMMARQIAELVGLPETSIRDCVAELEESRDQLPVDVPHPSFRGPF